MITDQSQWNGPLVASDGKRTVEVVAVEGPSTGGNYLVTFAESFFDSDGDFVSSAWFKPDGTALLPCERNITISPAAAGDICQLMPDGGGDASDETTALREEVARLREAVRHAQAVFEDYERLHHAKDTVDGYKKAATNRSHALKMSAALESTDQ